MPLNRENPNQKRSTWSSTFRNQTTFTFYEPQLNKTCVTSWLPTTIEFPPLLERHLSATTLLTVPLSELKQQLSSLFAFSFNLRRLRLRLVPEHCARAHVFAPVINVAHYIIFIMRKDYRSIGCWNIMWMKMLWYSVNGTCDVKSALIYLAAKLCTLTFLLLSSFLIPLCD